MKTKVPLDTEGIKQIGLDRCFQAFHWPFSHADYRGLTYNILNLWESTYSSSTKDTQALLLSDMRFIGFLMLHLHSKIVEAFCKRQGFEICYGNLGAQFLDPNFRSLENAYNPRNLKADLKLQLKRIIRNLKFNPSAGFIKRLSGHKCRHAIGLGSFSRLKRCFLEDQNLCLDNLYIEQLLSRRFEEYIPKDLFESVQGFLSNTASHVRNIYGVEIEETRLSAAFTQRLRFLGGFLESIRTGTQLAKMLLVSETANPFHRVTALAFQDVSGDAVGFHHGNGMGGLQRRMNHINTTGPYNKFVCPSKGCAQTYEKTYKKSFLNGFRDIEFISAESPYYNTLVQENSRRPLPRVIHNVMVMGFPMNARRNAEIGWNYFLFQLDLEVRLLKKIRELGYHALYKIHPERKKEVYDLIEPYCDVVIDQPFEKVWENTDAIVVKYSASTTFGFALCTNRPILMLDLEREFWFKDHYDCLARRCTMIPAWFGEHGRIIYDEDLFARALNDKPIFPDYSYVDKYMSSAALEL